MITRINLLPWRSEKLKVQKSLFRNQLIVSSLSGVIICLLVHSILQTMQDDEIKTNKILVQKSNVIDLKIKEINQIKLNQQQLKTNIELIRQTLNRRIELIQLLNEIPTLIPAGIYLTEFVEKDSEVTFIGKAQSNKAVSLFMKNIEESLSFTTPHLREIKSSDKTDTPIFPNDFTVSTSHIIDYNEQLNAHK